MTTQIEKLRFHFNGLNNTQKKAFIENLKQKLKSSPNAEYTKFLNECVSKYNTAVSGGSSIATTPKTKDTFDDLLEDTSDYNIAQPADRLIACLIDIGILIFFLWIIQFAISILMAGILLILNEILYDTSDSVQIMITFLIVSLLYIASIFLFFILFQVRYWKLGTSFGKDKMKLYVVNKETRNTISFGYMFLREVIGKWISCLIFSLGFIWILIDKDKQAWHDKLVSSVVVKKQGG